MIKRKLKICKGCKREKFIFSKGLCAVCYGFKFQKPLKSNKVVKHISNRQSQRLAKYNELREEYLKEHPNCEICNTPSDIIHHKNGRTGENLFKYFMTVCDPHHKEIHANPKESKEKGYLL